MQEQQRPSVSGFLNLDCHAGDRQGSAHGVSSGQLPDTLKPPLQRAMAGDGLRDTGSMAAIIGNYERHTPIKYSEMAFIAAVILNTKLCNAAYPA
jgi:hypothetical protein